MRIRRPILSRLFRLFAVWAVTLGFVEAQSGMLEAVGLWHCQPTCCDDEGGPEHTETDCPPACGDGVCCPGMARIVESAAAITPLDLLPAPAAVFPPANGHRADGSALRVFRPPRTSIA